MGKKSGTPTLHLTSEQIAPLQEQICSLVEPMLDPALFLVDVALEKEAGMWFLRLYLERKDSAISLSDCESASRLVDPAIEAFLERQPGLADFKYTLEISSPGLFRELKSPRELVYFQGRPIKMQNLKSKVSQEGILERYDPETRTLTLRHPDQNGTETFTYPSDSLLVTLNPHIVFPE